MLVLETVVTENVNVTKRKEELGYNALTCHLCFSNRSSSVFQT